MPPNTDLTDKARVVTRRYSMPRRAVLMSVLVLGALGACGPTESPGSFEVQEVVHSSKARLASTPVVSSELPVLTTPFQQTYPVIAVGHGVSLVVWVELINGSHPDVWGVRVRASDGAVLDAEPLRIGEGPGIQFSPAVAFGGDHFLVVWSHGENRSPIVYGRRVRASDGALMDEPTLISRIDSPLASQFPETYPSVAFDGTNYLVAWQGWYTQNGQDHNGIQAIRVSAATGQPIESFSIPLSTGGSESARVAYAQGRFLVAWHNGPNIYGARIDAATGARIDATPLPLATTPAEERFPSLASDGSLFLLAWKEGGSVKASRVSPVTGERLDGTGFTVGTAVASPPAAMFDGRSYWVGWQGTRDGERKLFGTRVSPQGLMESGEEVLLSAMHASSQAVAPSMAAAETGRFLVAYNQYDTKDSIKLRRVEDVPAPEACDEGEPTLVLSGSETMTLECNGAPYSDAGAEAFDACGNPLEVHAYNSGQDPYGPGPNTSAEGTYQVQYIAWDAMGKTVSALRTVLVDDQAAPVLRLRGAASMTHTCGSNWVDPGVDAMDACYGDIEASVKRVGSVNGWAAGTYTVKYMVSDSGGHSAEPVTRTVEVVDCPW